MGVAGAGDGAGEAGTKTRELLLADHAIHDLFNLAANIPNIVP